MDARFLLELSERERNVVLRALEDLARTTASEEFRTDVRQLCDRVDSLEPTS
jgi:hypothetical protein